MKELEKLREEIDEIDTKIIYLYEQRMNLIKDVTKYKIKNNIPTLVSSREKEMLDKNVTKINNKEFIKYYKYVLEGFLKASKMYQDDLKKGN